MESSCLCKKKTKKQTPKLTKRTVRNPRASKTDKSCYDNCCYTKKLSKNNVTPIKVRNTALTRRLPNLKKSKKVQIIKNTTPLRDLILSNEVNKDKKTIIRSFSPEVNRLIKSINEDNTKFSVMKNYFTPRIKFLKDDLKGKDPSDDVRYDMMDDELKKLLNNPFIKDKNGKKHSYTSKTAVEILINNLNKNVDCNKVIAPIQWQSNCWFNAGFMIYFISDKGRKFNRYLREAMITGSIVKRYNNALPKRRDEKIDHIKGIVRKNILPLKLKKLFFIFNLCIEASLSGNQMAYFMDTNFIIRNIYNILNKNKNTNFVKTNQASNPDTFYKSIKNYLFDTSSHDVVPIKEIEVIIENNYQLDKMIKTEYTSESAPDMIGVSIFDNNDGKPGNSGNIDKKKLKFNLVYNGEKVTYALDSVLIRDTSTRHFCCLITCNGKDLGFDGESYHRMSPFEWRKLINENKSWTFEGSNVDWNFRNGYQKLYYYRV